ncbi:MAG: hypothetical protein HY820_35340 [Acidobacteria bacterium]|nr:hypothetical protein [Acidobacteriota bacterium]
MSGHGGPLLVEERLLDARAGAGGDADAFPVGAGGGVDDATSIGWGRFDKEESSWAVI